MIGGFILGGSNQQHRHRGARDRAVAGPVRPGQRAGRSDPGVARQQWRAFSSPMITGRTTPSSAAQLTARGLAPQNPLESGIFASLPPGAFTAILAGKNGGTGIGLVEIYNVQ